MYDEQIKPGTRVQYKDNGNSGTVVRGKPYREDWKKRGISSKHHYTWVLWDTTWNVTPSETRHLCITTKNG